MSKKETVIENYNCPVLGSNAKVTITYLSLPGLKEPVEFDCNKTHECGIAQATSATSWRYDWSSCPRHSALNQGRR